MLKKADVIEVLNRLPEEFERDELFAAVTDSADLTPLSEKELKALDQAEEEFARDGGVPLAEVKEEVAEWLASRSS